jgi:hypothetical protein
MQLGHSSSTDGLARTSAPAPSTSAAASASAAMSALGTHSLPAQTSQTLPAFPAFYDVHKDVVVVSAVPCRDEPGPAPSRGEGSSVAVTPGWRR